MPPFPRLRLLLLSCLLAFAVGGPVLAHTGQRAQWVGEIRVFNPTGWQRNFRAAADAWNRTGVTPKFVFVHHARRGQVTVTASTKAVAARCDETYPCDAVAQRRGRHGAIWLPTQVGEERRSPALVRLIVHELGHVLGLRHEVHDCARMNTDTGARLCGALRVPPDTYECGPLQHDLLAAERLYGARPDPSYRAWCSEHRTADRRAGSGPRRSS
jgi:hypothetical protein